MKVHIHAPDHQPRPKVTTPVLRSRILENEANKVACFVERHAPAQSDGPSVGSVRHAVEGIVGFSIGDISIYSNDEAAKRTGRAGARAMTVGRDIFLGREALGPGGAPRVHTLAHEMVHVIQQTATSPRSSIVSPGAARGCGAQLQELEPTETGAAPAGGTSGSAFDAASADEMQQFLEAHGYSRWEITAHVTSSGVTRLDEVFTAEDQRSGSDVVGELGGVRLADSILRQLQQASMVLSDAEAVGMTLIYRVRLLHTTDLGWVGDIEPTRLITPGSQTGARPSELAEDPAFTALLDDITQLQDWYYFARDTYVEGLEQANPLLPENLVWYAIPLVPPHLRRFFGRRVPRFSELARHTRQHGLGMSGRRYYQDALEHVATARRRFRFYHDRQFKWAYITPRGDGTSTFSLQPISVGRGYSRT